MISGAAQSPAAVAGVKETPKVQRPGIEARERLVKPVLDEYVPEEKKEPSGRYWMGRDENGRPKICFDDPGRAADVPGDKRRKAGKALGGGPKQAENSLAGRTKQAGNAPTDKPGQAGDLPADRTRQTPAPPADKPKQAEDAPEKPDASDPQKSQKAQRCTGNTDKVDREIKKLKKEKQELKQQLNMETDENKIKDLKAKLAQVERELRQKDNDAYRRQHSIYTFS